LTFTVTLSRASRDVVRVEYATADGSAAAGVDYTAASGELSFLPGETAKQLTVLVTGDADVEPDETLTVNLSNAKEASIADGQATGTISNDDVGPPPTLPSLSINDPSLSEGLSDSLCGRGLS
jgi:Calx-beta domain